MERIQAPKLKHPKWPNPHIEQNKYWLTNPKNKISTLDLRYLFT